MLPSGAEGMKFCHSQGELAGVSVFTDSKDEAELFWVGFQLECNEMAQYWQAGCEDEGA